MTPALYALQKNIKMFAEVVWSRCRTCTQPDTCGDSGGSASPKRICYPLRQVLFYPSVKAILTVDARVHCEGRMIKNRTDFDFAARVSEPRVFVTRRGVRRTAGQSTKRVMQLTDHGNTAAFVSSEDSRTTRFSLPLR